MYQIKARRIQFPTVQTVCHLDIPMKSYGHFTVRCTAGEYNLKPRQKLPKQQQLQKQLRAAAIFFKHFEVGLGKRWRLSLGLCLLIRVSFSDILVQLLLLVLALTLESYLQIFKKTQEQPSMEIFEICFQEEEAWHVISGQDQGDSFPKAADCEGKVVTLITFKLGHQRVA